jgi:hypothetical protein
MINHNYNMMIFDIINSFLLVVLYILIIVVIKNAEPQISDNTFKMEKDFWNNEFTNSKIQYCIIYDKKNIVSSKNKYNAILNDIYKYKLIENLSINRLDAKNAMKEIRRLLKLYHLDIDIEIKIKDGSYIINNSSIHN